MTARCGPDELFAGKLAAAIDAKRIDARVLAIRALTLSIEHVVGRQLDDCRPHARGRLGDFACSVGVDAEGALRLILGLVDGGVSCGVDHHVGR